MGGIGTFSCINNNVRWECFTVEGGLHDPQGHWQWVRGNKPFLRCGEQGSTGAVASILFFLQPHLKGKRGAGPYWWLDPERNFWLWLCFPHRCLVLRYKKSCGLWKRHRFRNDSLQCSLWVSLYVCSTGSWGGIKPSALIFSLYRN